MRNEKSAYGSVSLTLGVISFTLAFIMLVLNGPIYYLMGYVLMWVAPIVAIVYGIVGLVKDHKIPMAIIGLNFTIAFFILILIRYLTYYYFILL
ncbi:MAG: hypothetical protein ACFFDX_01145 [Candidatus Odinarchaeota archaeon]